MSLDSSLLGVEGTAQMIAQLIRIYNSETDSERKIYHEDGENR